METIMNKSLCICGCCKRELPQEAFYMNQRTRTTDNYCKVWAGDSDNQRLESSFFQPTNIRQLTQAVFWRSDKMKGLGPLRRSLSMMN